MSGAYFDSAYIAKCYVNEPDSAAVRALVSTFDSISSSEICIAEVAAVFHRHAREGHITRAFAKKLNTAFLADLDDDVWSLLPVARQALRNIATVFGTLPDTVPLRSADAIHLLAAKEHGFDSVWTNDRHMLGVAPLFNLQPKSVH